MEVRLGSEKATNFDDLTGENRAECRLAKAMLWLRHPLQPRKLGQQLYSGPRGMLVVLMQVLGVCECSKSSSAVHFSRYLARASTTSQPTINFCSAVERPSKIERDEVDDA